MTNSYVHKVTIVTVIVLFAFFFSPIVINAGDYHNDTGRGAPSDTLACSQCHTIHNSQGGQSLIYASAADTTVQYDKLLRAENILALCLHCHGDKASSPTAPVDAFNRIPPRVFDTKSLPSGSYTPSAGDFADRGNVNEANRHSIYSDVSSFEPPGYTAGDWSNVTTAFTSTFNCLYCHAQHGNENYRNLRYDPGVRANDTKAAGVTITYATSVEGVVPGGTCSDGTAYPCDVYVVNPLGLTAAGTNREKYYRENVTFGVSNANGDNMNAISTFCGKCHNNFYGESGNALVGGNTLGAVGDGDKVPSLTAVGTTPWVRHPVGDITFDQSKTVGGNAHIDVDNLTGNIEGSITMARFADGTDFPPGGYLNAPVFQGVDGEQPFCLTCHYAHGGGNTNFATDQTLDHSNLVFSDLEGDVNIEPDATYDNANHYMRNTCNQCHNQ